MTLTMGTDSQVAVVLTGAQAGGISKLRIVPIGDCGDDGVTVFGELPIDQSDPVDMSVIGLTQEALAAGSLTTLAYDPETGTFTANTPHDANGEVWLLERSFTAR